MKNMFKELTEQELTNKLKDFKKELFDLKLKLSRRTLDNPMKIRSARKDIARILTILKEKQKIPMQAKGVKK